MALCDDMRQMTLLDRLFFTGTSIVQLLCLWVLAGMLGAAALRLGVSRWLIAPAIFIAGVAAAEFVWRDFKRSIRVMADAERTLNSSDLLP